MAKSFLKFPQIFAEIYIQCYEFVFLNISKTFKVLSNFFQKFLKSPYCFPVNFSGFTKFFLENYCKFRIISL